MFALDSESPKTPSFPARKTSTRPAVRPAPAPAQTSACCVFVLVCAGAGLCWSHHLNQHEPAQTSTSTNQRICAGLCWCGQGPPGDPPEKCNLLFALVIEFCSDALLHGYLTILDCDIIFDIVSGIWTYYLSHFSPALILGATGTC